ncbi:D-glycerate dehydrogenase [Sulfitobacter sp. M57]|uniref:2-hydroxyacid dehydrogenase n=1 Tax=unclassified Sulfitobacter TaxID=196795 RepID=UPI0023E28DDC|nr:MULTISPECIES: D-glycerate dehydrogenase [unclassified Sulfitobacter]MDF3415915.1 D-glycerate dehydrogenase [Sulfitobacter sp. KE5]MDF3423395.1 D-glycerate dehydrogenase [Sulfitobacter sp. KE43]MDF3434461.1 D-glycerate dehydrogenase [Sulfitobacter sp. KE42]MDF3460101.1 D-glycerate dehydrogenase [Sulfitobacter sp. S74]MDF3463999.1 D-glycerate dehydrogenase [Sulfitobacter sp. Ks18]
MHKLLITRPLPHRVLEAAKASFDVTVRADNSPLSVPERASALADFDAVLPTLGDQFPADAFDGQPRARILANFGVGFNHIDAVAARAAGLEVTNTPGAVTDATADIAMTLMLMTCRRAGEGERMVRAGDWPGWHPTQLLGMHVSGKTLGVIGMGRIGKAIAKRAAAGFGMQVVFYNRSPVTGLPFEARQLETLQEVMQAADVVVLAVPATPQTHHMIDAAALAAMTSDSYLINISRGDVIDEAALIAALQDERIAGAGLDVYEFEPKVPAALIALENVTLLPHLGTSAQEVREQMGLMAVDNLVAFFAGKPVPNPV